MQPLPPFKRFKKHPETLFMSILINSFTNLNLLNNMSSQHTGDIQIKKTPTNQNNQRERSFSFILPQKYSHLLLHISTVSLYFLIYIFWILFTSPFYCLSSAACREQDFGISSDFVIIQKTGMP